MEPEVISACENVCRDFYWFGPFTEWLADIAIPVGVLIALYQLSLWRREHIAKRKAETSLRLLSKALSIKRAIAVTRSAMESIPEDSSDSTTAIMELKWSRLVSFNDDFDELRELQVLHEALVGTLAVHEAVEKLFDVREEIFAALSTLRGWKLDGRSSKADMEFHQKLQQSIYAMGKKYDSISPEVNDAISVLRTELLPEIRMQK